MLSTTSSYWLKYLPHVFKWEGGLSKDPRDTAVKCAPFAGAYHTNKGVTYCTFKALAKKLNIAPVDYNKFVTLTNEEAGRFPYEYYKAVDGANYPDSVAVAMTEAAWGSGPVRAFKHLQEALADIGRPVPVTGATNQATRAQARAANEAKLFDAYQARRKTFLLDVLGNNPKYAMYKKGWGNRLNDFNSIFRPGVPGINPLMLLFLFFGSPF